MYKFHIAGLGGRAAGRAGTIAVIGSKKVLCWGRSLDRCELDASICFALLKALATDLFRTMPFPTMAMGTTKCTLSNQAEPTWHLIGRCG